MLELGISKEESASQRADSRMHQAGVLSVLGVLPIGGFFGLVFLVQVTSVDAHPGCGLFLAAFAMVLFPAAAIAFCVGLVLSVSALSGSRELITPANLVVVLVNAVGAGVFGYFLIGMFFGQFLI